MSSYPHEDGNLDRLLHAIPVILRSPSLQDSLPEALELLRRGAGAEAVVVFLADGDAPLREYWAPDDAATKSSLRPRLKVESLEAIRRGGAHLTVTEGAAQDGRATRTLLLATDTGPLGAAALAWSSPSAPDTNEASAWITAAIEMVASTVIHRSEVAKLKNQAERDKRWFQTLDEHLRVLDRERQKFAAVVNQTDTFVFVTDEERMIRWNNRAMGVLLPFADDSSSWIGKPCREVCARLGHAPSGPDSCDCPIRRALEQNEVTHQELRLSLKDTPGVLYLTALPIKGLDGKPREAMILVQDLTGLETLRQSEVRYSVLFERHPEAILMVDPDTRAILLANPAAQRMLGYAAQEITRLPLQSLYSREEWERIGEFYSVAPSQPASARIQCRVVTKEGVERIVLTSSTRVALEGRSVDLVGLVDVTMGLQAEQALGESQARQGAMIEAALDAIVSTDHAGRVLEFNPAAERTFGVKRADALGRDMADLIIPPRLRDQHRQGMADLLSTGEERDLGKRFESVAKRADGSELPVELTIARISAQGPPVFTAFIRDLTEQKTAERALRDAEARLRTVVAESPVIVFALDRDGIYTVSSGKGLAAMGRREGETVGQSIYEIYRDYPDVLANIDRCLAGEEFSALIDVGRHSFDAHYAPVRNAQGEVIGLFGVATDITDRKELEAQLRHAQKMEAVGRLAGGVAHDFNNLLTVIQGHSEVMLSKMPAADTLRASAEEIQKAGARGALLTRQLLAFSRKDIMNPEVLDLSDVVREMQSMLYRLIGEDVSLVTRTGGWPLRVRADRGQMEQVLANLAVNARDAMPQGGELVIEVSALELQRDGIKGLNLPAGPYVALTVADQGNGMGPDVLAHLFEPFYTTKEQGKGTGLGLSVVYGIVRQSGGDIVVESRPGQGATFRILLPRVGEAEPSHGPGAPADALESAGEGEGTILLVEDEGAVRALARDFLIALGHGVIEADCGEKALALFQQHADSIQAVVSDVVMPGMSGVELARRLVAIQPGLKILLLSGYARDSFDAADITRGRFAFLQKPYTLEDFARKVADVVAGSSVGDPSGTG
jgi:PAS domain S-box-containing protein